MAFATAPGYGNLPNGNFSPVIYAKKAQIAFRKASVIQHITNTDYMGEIRDFGDTVKIIKEPNITVQAYVRGSQVTPQDLDDEEILLVIDKANWMAFKVDDIESKQSHINWESLAADQGGYRLADAMDTEVLQNMSDNLVAAQTLGTSSVPQDVQETKAAGDFTPLQLLSRLARFLDVNNVPSENRWFVGDPIFYEQLQDEDSKLLDADFTEKGIIRSGDIVQGKVRGFTMYTSNNLPSAGAGPSGTTNSDHGVLLGGHMSAVSTAEQINKTETFRSQDTFADVVRGLHMYGRKVLREEALVGAFYHSV